MRTKSLTAIRSRRRAVGLCAAVVAIAASGLASTTVAAPASADGKSGDAAAEVARARPGGFDLEGHRGTRGLRPEDTIPAFAKALDLGVRTLELDTGVTGDGVVIVSHERLISPLVCTDTAPITPGDPSYPYVGKYFSQLTFAQVESVDCGARHPVDPTTDPYYASQLPVPGTRIPALDQVFDLVEQRGARDVQLNIETKIDPTQPDQTVAPEQFVAAGLAVMQRHRGGVARSLLQSFDWRTLAVARRTVPELRRVALVDAETAEVGKPGTSPWLGGLDIDAAPYYGDAAAAAGSVAADVLSPDYKFLTAAMLASAHQRGQLVVPWTVNDVQSMVRLVQQGVDGLITDYPDRGRDVLSSLGVSLPRAYPAH